jgi:hypothetical protein
MLFAVLRSVTVDGRLLAYEEVAPARPERFDRDLGDLPVA